MVIAKGGKCHLARNLQAGLGGSDVGEEARLKAIIEDQTVRTVGAP